MIGWTIFIGYVIGFVLCWRWFTRAMANSDGMGLGAEDRLMFAVLGFLLAFAWPPVLAFMGLKRLVFPGGVRSDGEVADDMRRRLDEQAAELAALKQRARELGLPFPDAPAPK
jgi:hypothetical protein